MVITYHRFCRSSPMISSALFTTNSAQTSMAHQIAVTQTPTRIFSNPFRRHSTQLLSGAKIGARAWISQLDEENLSMAATMK